MSFENKPAWKKEFPISQSEEHKRSRRTFTKFLGASLVAIAGGYLIKDKIFTHPISGPKTTVATTADLKVGAYKLFKYPENQPCILIRLGKSEYVAYSQSCTHLMCPINYNSEKQQLVCPCHEGYFDVKTGDVLSGPPPRPLPRYKVSIENQNIVIG